MADEKQGEALLANTKSDISSRVAYSSFSFSASPGVIPTTVGCEHPEVDGTISHGASTLVQSQ